MNGRCHSNMKEVDLDRIPSVPFHLEPTLSTRKAACIESGIECDRSDDGGEHSVIIMT